MLRQFLVVALLVSTCTNLRSRDYLSIWLHLSSNKRYQVSRLYVYFAAVRGLKVAVERSPGNEILCFERPALQALLEERAVNFFLLQQLSEPEHHPSLAEIQRMSPWITAHVSICLPGEVLMRPHLSALQTPTVSAKQQKNVRVDVRGERASP